MGRPEIASISVENRQGTTHFIVGVVGVMSIDAISQPVSGEVWFWVKTTAGDCSVNSRFVSHVYYEKGDE